MTLTKIQTALYDLWFKYYTTDLTGKQRSTLVQSFIDEYADVDLTTAQAKHPAHYRRRSSIKHRLYPINEILGDFIIHAESDDTKLTASAQTGVNREHKRNEREVYTDFTDSYDDGANVIGRRTGQYTEYDVYKARQGDLYIDFTLIKDDDMTVDRFKALLTTVKNNADKYAAMYGKRFNKDYQTTMQRIRRLDVDRVAICEECGEVYYMHDLRRKYCDLRPSCVVNAKRRRESERYYGERSKKVKDRAERLHYVIEGQRLEPFLIGS